MLWAAMKNVLVCCTESISHEENLDVIFQKQMYPLTSLIHFICFLQHVFHFPPEI